MRTSVAFICLFVIPMLAYSLLAQESLPENTVSPNTKEVLLIGTFHFNNPGADVAKTKSFDILNEKSQNELEDLAAKIYEYKPDQIFVEWDYEQQPVLDSLYTLYLNDSHFIKENKDPFYQKNEIFQLAFRCARKLGMKNLVAMDYRNTEFPFDSLMTVISKNNQTDIQKRILGSIEKFTVDFDNMIESGSSLTDLLLYINTPELRIKSNDLHSRIPLLAGEKENFIGPYLAAEWYRRNLYMWSLIQKQTSGEDDRIMVLVGGGHAAMFESFIADDPQWTILELSSLLE